MTKADGSINDPQSMPGYGGMGQDKDLKSSPTDPQTANAAEKLADSAADGAGSKDQPQSAMPSSAGATASATAEQKVAPGGHDSNLHELDLRALSPTPRKSERGRPPV